MELLRGRLEALQSRGITFDSDAFNLSREFFSIILPGGVKSFLDYKLKKNSLPENRNTILGIPETAREFLRESGADSEGAEYWLSLWAFIQPDEHCPEFNLRGKDLGLTEIVRFSKRIKFPIRFAIPEYSYVHNSYGFTDLQMLNAFFLEMFERQAPEMLTPENRGEYIFSGRKLYAPATAVA